jgi:peptide/nickel transport system substrate-binding protein
MRKIISVIRIRERRIPLKRIICLLIALTMVFGLAACGGKDTSKPTPNPAASPDTAAPEASAEAKPAVAGYNPGDASIGSADPGKDLEPQYGGTLRMAVQQDTSDQFGLPWELTMSQALIFLTPITESLLNETSDAKYTGALAETWDIDAENGLVTFHLRKGIKFSDGSDWNAEVAAWNFQKSIDAKTMNPNVKGVKATGEYDLQIDLGGSYLNSILSIMASHCFSFISKESYDKNGEDYARTHPVGTGPFMLEEYVPGEKVTYTKNENYWQDGQPYLDRVEFYVITDVMTQNAALMSTGGDACQILVNISQGEQISTLVQTLGDQIYIDRFASGVMALFPSSMDEASPLNKLEVRQAISYALDRQALCDARGFGILEPAAQLIPEGYDGHIDDPAYAVSYDPEKAKQLLADAGYPDGFELTVNNLPPVDRDMCVAIQSMLEAVGIKVTGEYPEAGLAATLRSEWDGLLFYPFTKLPATASITRLYLDPGYQFFPKMLRPDGYEELYNAQRVTEQQDPVLSANLFKSLMDDMTIIPVYNNYTNCLIRSNVHNTGWGIYTTQTMWTPGSAWIEQ